MLLTDSFGVELLCCYLFSNPLDPSDNTISACVLEPLDMVIISTVVWQEELSGNYAIIVDGSREYMSHPP